MKSIKHSAIQFAKSINLTNKRITLKGLLHAARKKGFIIKSYSESATLLMAFGLYDESREADSVSVIDKSGTAYIFIDNLISENSQLFALAHELGHIILKHRKTPSLKKQQERQADLFAHYLLSSSSSTLIINIAITVTSVILITCIILITVFITYSNNEKIKTVSAESESSVNSQSAEASNSTVCYFTRYGTVYHIYRDCFYLKNSTKIYTDTVEECHLDKLCSACKHRQYKE